MSRAQRKKEAAALRRVALQAEANEAFVLANPELNSSGRRHISGPEIDQRAYPIGFTCNMVSWEVGEDARNRYEACMLTDKRGRLCEKQLWDAQDCYSIRVLLVCFAAAMAETRDLT